MYTNAASKQVEDVRELFKEAINGREMMEGKWIALLPQLRSRVRRKHLNDTVRLGK